MTTSKEAAAILARVVEDLVPPTATEAERFAFAAALVEAAERFLPAPVDDVSDEEAEAKAIAEHEAQRDEGNVYTRRQRPD